MHKKHILVHLKRNHQNAENEVSDTQNLMREGPQTHVWVVSSGMGPLARCPLFFNIEGGNLIHQLVANIVCPLFGAGQVAHSWFLQLCYWKRLLSVLSEQD